MRKFAWIFMAAMTVAGFSACSNTEDDPLPGLGGGDGDGGSTPSVTITNAIYQFNEITKSYQTVDEFCPDWTVETVKPIGDSNQWKGYIYNSTNDKYLRASAYFDNPSNNGIEHELWLFSPALNVKDATNKNFSFYTEGSNWQETSTLEVYVLNEPKSTSGKEKLNVKIATSSDGNYKWVASGNISLEGKGDIVYIGFCYKGIGESCTTYCLDDFAFGRNQEAHFIGTDDTGDDDPVSPDTPEVDWSTAISVADALAQSTGVASVKGYIVGTLKAPSAGGGTKFDSFGSAQASGSVEWNGATEFTGYNVVFIADDANETDGSKCLLVRIGDITEFKDAVKLEGHPERIGTFIYAQGNRTGVYGLPGLRNLTAYKIGE